ncbi:DUF302 domain-containing protein [Bauldia sp.]|uniref:DUF302 domain-containing protein n=1 Tax=Bauldia sp. TaxID=2575872 RepID=UPI003BAA43EF
MLRITTIALGLAMISAPLAVADDGWIEKTSPHTVADTTAKLTAAVENAGARVFAVVDHAAGAESVEMELAPNTAVIFGNPRVGTPLIQANPLMGYELPLRVLIWDDGGTTKVGYRDPAAVAAAYDVDAAEAVAMAAGAIDNLTGAAIAP